MGHKLIPLAASISLALALLAAGGCGHKEKTEVPPKEAYGIVDMETLVKAHPRYAEYFRLETEYKELLAQYQSEQRSLVRKADLRQRQEQALASTAANQAAEEEYKARVKIKEDSLNQQIKNLYNEIESRHRTVGKPQMQGATEEEENRIANLQLKLKVVGISGDEKAAAETELQTLLNGRYAGETPTGWTAEETAQLAAKKKAAEEELERYAKAVADEIRTKRESQMAALQASPLPEPELWNKDWEDRIKAKQKQMADVKAAIMDDIRAKAAVIGQEKQLTLIFSEYRANVNAVDVTGELVSDIVQIPVKQ